MNVVLFLSALTLAATTALVLLGTVLIDELLPADRSRIVGLALGDWGGVTRIPRRALDCTTREPSPSSESCTVTIDDAVLTIDVDYEDPRNLRFQRCEASYGPATTACWQIWFALTGGPPRYASIPTVQPGRPHETVQWLGPGRVQPLQAPHLEVRDEALQAIRQRYPLDNFYERDWGALIGAAAGSVGVGIAALAFATTGGRHREGSAVSAGRPVAITRVALAVAFGGVAFCFVYVGLLLRALVSGLVD